MDQLLVNRRLWGLIDTDLRPIFDYSALVAEHCGMPIPASYPALGEDAFRTGTGVHASAVVKALRKGERALAALGYSGRPASAAVRPPPPGVDPLPGVPHPPSDPSH